MTIKNAFAIPEELRLLKQWILWRYEDKNGNKPTKVPYSIAHNLASVTNPNDWSTFNEAFNIYQLGSYDGIGFVFTNADPYSFIDLDDCSSSPNAKSDMERQLKIFKEFNSYSEVSPSGKGLHIIVKGNLPQGRRRSFIELYSSQRYATMTGNVYNNVPIADRNELLNTLFKQMGGGNNVSHHSGNAPQTEEDEKIIEQASNATNGDKFKTLNDGDWQSIYQSQSEADFAYIDIIAFYTQNKEQITRIFRASPLGQRKKAQRKDYIEWMINKSFDKLPPAMDFDGFRIALEEKIAQQSVDNANSDVYQENIAVSGNGSPSAFDADRLGSNPSTATSLDSFNSGVSPSGLRPAAHNSLITGSNPVTPTTHNEENDRWFLSQIEAGIISISEEGLVFNHKTNRYIGSMGSGGYPKISLTKEKDENGKWIICHMQIHRLVWIKYKGFIPQGMQLNHKDLDKSNPRLDNLELVTPSENMQHALEAGVLNTFEEGNNYQALRQTVGNRYGTVERDNSDNASLAQGIEHPPSKRKVEGSTPSGSAILPPPGLVGEIAQFIYSAAPRPVPEIALAAAIGFMAGICGRAYNVSGTGLNQYILLLANTGCHAKGTKILKYDGTFINVEHIWPGDLLMGPDSKPRKVLNLARGREPMVKIKPTKGEEFIVNLGHILSLVHTKTRERINITVRDYINTHKTFKHLYKLERKAVEFEHNIDLPIDPWFLGAMLGDGSFGPAINLTSKDDAILDKALSVVNAIGVTARITQVEGNKAFQHTYMKVKKSNFIGERESKLQRIIKELKLWAKRSHDKFIPHCYKTSSRADRMALLAGLLDTDGSLTCNGYDFISKSEQLANDVVYVARSLGLAAYVKSCEKYSQNGSGGIYHRVSISGDCSELPLVLEYKRAQPRKQKKDVLVTGFTYEMLPEDDYYGFSLDSDHLYLTGDFTVHHNTGKESMASGIDKIINEVSLQVPVAGEFIGPSEIASGQALIKFLANKSQSFVSILGEFGKRLQVMSDPRANGAEKTLNRMMLDLYNKSGHGQVARPSIYADSEKNTNLISSPAFSILAESTPETFYSALTEEMIADGLLPRFMLIEYNGPRPALNENHRNAQFNDGFIGRIADLMAIAKTVMANRKVTDVMIDDDAAQILHKFDKLADNKINSTDKEVVRQLWNRAHIKVLKISALIAVGVNCINPVVTKDYVLWAKNMVEDDIKSLSAKFESGLIGRNSEEIKQFDLFKKHMIEYATNHWNKIKPYCNDQEQTLHSHKYTPGSFMNNRIAKLAAFRKDKNGGNFALKRCIQMALNEGFIIQVSKTELTRLGKTATCYMISDASSLYKDV